MKNKGGFFNFFVAIIIAYLITCNYCYAAGYDTIDITNPFLRKIPIAIPVFKPLTENEIEIQLSKEGAEFLSKLLNFTGYFKILDRMSFLDDPSKTGILAQNINFKNWVTVGSELLVTGGLSIKDNAIEVELRLFDTIKAQLVIGKRYQGQKEDLYKIVKRFCSEILYYLTKSWGYFDSKIAFISTGTGKKEIYICDFDGQNIQSLTQNKTITIFPAWSSDGSYISYISYLKGKPDLYIKNINDKRAAAIVQNGSTFSSSWAPGKFMLAASISFSGNSEIYLLTGNGKIIRKLTDSWGIDVSPSWSPDGKKIAFVSDRAGSPQIYIMNIDSGQTDRLTFQGKYNTSPCWSPKGDKIVYTLLEGSENNICVIGPDGNNFIQITNGQGFNESPSWSPDGSLIVFSSNREGSRRIYIMTAYGTDQRRLFTLPGEQIYPSWSPRIAE